MRKLNSQLRSGKLVLSVKSFRIGATMILVLAVGVLAGCAGAVLSTPPNSAPGPTTLQVTTNTLPAATDGVAYSTTLAATGGTPPYTWSTTGGALPTGLGLSAATGAIAGTPTQSGTFSFKAQVQDSKAASASTALSLTVASGAPALQVTTNSLPAATNGIAYTATLAAMGGTPPYTWSTTGGALPTGLGLSAATGVIAGTATQSGTFSFKAQVQDSKAVSATAPLSLTVAPPNSAALQVTTSSLPPATQGVAYSTTLAAAGGTPPYTWSNVGGTLPAGLGLSAATGVIAGTATQSGTFSFKAQVQDSKAVSASAPLSLTVAPPTPPTLQVTTNSLPAAADGVPYTATLAATGGTPPYTWSTVGGALPAGLGLIAATGVIAGTATQSGTFPFNAQVKDSKAVSASAALSLTAAPYPAPTIAGISPASGPMAGGTTVTISGNNFRSGAGVQFGNVSASIVQVTSAAQIQAITPSEPAAVVNVAVKNSDGQTATAANAFTFLSPPLQIVTSTLPTGSVGASYSITLSATGGTAPYTWKATSGAFPAGVQLNGSTGIISGTPSASGSFPITIQVTDAKGVSSSATFSLTISSQPAPTISSVSPTSGPVAGGTTVTISGTNFRSGASVLFGTVAATSVQIVSSTQILAVTPAEVAGIVSVSVKDSDGQVASAPSAFTFNAPASPVPVVPTPSSDPAAPVIFNWSSSAQPGDVISIQGVNFDSASQAWLGGATLSAATQLKVVNRVGQTWMGVQVPQSWTGAMVLWVSNSHGASASVALNGAIPTHLDALQLVPGGAFRVIGRNLLAQGFNPSVTIDGLPATINVGASDENILVATAPTSLSPTSAAVILVDNGNGTGATQLDRKISVVAGSGDPMGLGVGWGAGFKFAGNVTKVNTPCNGSQDDTNAILSAISSVPASGGVVQLPAGTCRVTKSLPMKSNLVLQGAGKDVTILKYDANYPITAQNCDLVGVEDLSFVNSGAATQGPLWQQNTRSFLQRVKIDMGASQQLFFTDNVNLVVSQTDFIQRASIGERGPYVFNSSSGLVFTGNTTTSIDGSPAFQSTHDALYLNNHFTRDAKNQNENPVVVTHRFVMDFTYRIAIVGNTFDVINGPITNKTRNDGETLLTEGGGSARTENRGTVSSATSTTISDPSNTINVNPFGTGLPENYGVAIVNGTGAGQTREVVAYSNHTMTVDHPWDVIPDSTSRYATFVWGLEKSLIKGNTLVDNPRGIWLYETAIREVDILGNTITNGGGIFLETLGNEAKKQFDPMYNVRIRGNKVSNSNGIWMSYATVVFVNQEPVNFGIANIGIEIRNNILTANTPNVTSSTEDYASQEGFMNLMRIQASGGQLGTTPMLLGTIFQGGQCVNCSYPFIIGTGAYGTTLINNQPASTTPNFLSNWQTLGSNYSGALNTVVQ